MSLLRAEIHRFRSRRFIVVLLLLGAAAFTTGIGIAATQFSKPTAAGLAAADQRIVQVIAEQKVSREQCLASVPTDQPPESYCGLEMGPGEFRREDFLDKQPFVLATAGPSGATGLAGATAALLFLLGATWVGAEWSTRSMVALLFWEPRRVKVIVTKLAVLLAAAAGVAVAVQVAWFGAARLLGSTRGTTSGLPEGYTADLVATGGRGVLLGVLVAALGFSLANLVRNTGAALGIGFAYVVVVENAVRALRPAWQEWLLTTNAGALLSDGGVTYYLQDTFVDDKGVLQSGREMLLTNLHGGLVLGVASAALVTLGVVLFSRRDLH